jgi:hypothetical protein
MELEQLAQVIRGTVEQSGYLRTDEGHKVARDIAIGIMLESGIGEDDCLAFLADCGLS